MTPEIRRIAPPASSRARAMERPPGPPLYIKTAMPLPRLRGPPPSARLENSRQPKASAPFRMHSRSPLLENGTPPSTGWVSMMAFGGDVRSPGCPSIPT